MVAGIIAQWMEAVPTLSREQVLEVFEATCRRPDSSLTYPNNDYGYGEIDAEAGLDYLLSNYDGLASVPSSLKQRGIYDLQGRRVEHPSKGIYIITDEKGIRKKVFLNK
jgi:hypothetical protein